MRNKTKKTIIFAIGASILLGLAATAGAYYAKQAEDKTTTVTSTKSLPKSMQNKTAAVNNNSDMPWKNSAPAQKQAVNTQQQPAQADCDDSNVVGLATGAILGGLVGNQLGKGKGNTAATVAGAAGGAYVGQQYIPTKGVACR